MFELAKYITDFFIFPRPEAIKLWAEEYEQMSVHTRGKKPSSIIDKRRPYEAEEIKTYRIENYEPITKDPINRAIDNLQRIFTKSAVGYQMPDDLRQYLDLNEFEGTNFWTYIQKKPVRRMVEDANGVLVWWPIGKGTQEQNQKVNVRPHLILSKNIFHFTDDVFSWLSAEKSEVIGPKGTEYSGEVYYIITRDGYHKLVQHGKKSDKKFEIEVHYAQKFDFLPVITLGGVETGELNEKTNIETPYLSSFFSSYCAYANEAIRQFSDHQAVMVTSAHPMREIDPVDCMNPVCKDGAVYVDNVKQACPDCEGKGYVLPNSPFGVIVRPKEKRKPGEQKGQHIPALEFISPDVSIIKYGGEHWEYLLQKAEKSLNLLFIQEAQSGKAKEVDREDKYSMLDKIGENVVLNIIINSITVINLLRNIKATRSEITASLPDTFKLKNEEQLLTELGSLIEKKAPEFLVAATTKEVIRIRYGQNRTLSKIADCLEAMDPFFAYSTDKKQELNAATVMTDEEMLKSIHAPRLLVMVSNEMGTEFETATFIDIEAKLDALLVPIYSRGITKPSGENE